MQKLSVCRHVVPRYLFCSSIFFSFSTQFPRLRSERTFSEKNNKIYTGHFLNSFKASYKWLFKLVISTETNSIQFNSCETNEQSKTQMLSKFYETQFAYFLKCFSFCPNTINTTLMNYLIGAICAILTILCGITIPEIGNFSLNQTSYTYPITFRGNRHF